jgi:hypothetical protein
LNDWATISQGKPSRRKEVVYNVEPAAGVVREGDWKLVWKAQLPASLELFDLAGDPYEKTNLASGNPTKVRELQQRINDLAGTMEPPLFMKSGLAEVMQLPPAFPWYRPDAATRARQKP